MINGTPFSQRRKSGVLSSARFRGGYVLFLCLFILTGCSEQPLLSLRVKYRNACNHPVYVTPRNFTSFEEYTNSTQALGLGDSKIILLLLSSHKDFQIAIPNNYMLEIKNGDRERLVNKAQLISILNNKKEDPRPIECLTIYECNYNWTINDPSLCP
jgi:hypothetical protein